MRSCVPPLLTLLKSLENLLIVECLREALNSGQGLLAVPLLDTNMNIILCIGTLLRSRGCIFRKRVCKKQNGTIRRYTSERRTERERHA